ncbi:MAG TPA: L,D-transpeptidase family protein [Anaerolineaceae bacterium]|nr:L,D-transpeptidase family protein [Anaerolineaceae bacterium]
MTNLSRRDFLKWSALGLAGLAGSAYRPWDNGALLQSDWPEGQQLGRNCVGGMINLRSQPSEDAPVVEQLYEDTVVVWQREVVGEPPSGTYSRRWVETPKGYLYAPSVQPVFYRPNQPVSTLEDTSLGRGMWVEVTVPYVDIFLVQEKPASPWLQAIPRPRLYYGQVMWIDDITTNSNNQVLYRVGEQYGSYGDVFWAAAEAFRPITPEDIAPIHPEIAEKKIVVDLNHQVLSCFEGQQEVYFCRISSGAKFDAQGNAVDKWATPVGPHPIWRKLISVHMSGGSTGAGWDTPGIGWTTFFAQEGVAIHSTFWHNDFGAARSHGCVNATIEDSKWIFRWTQPEVSYAPGDVTVGMPGGTIVDVVGV